MEAFVATNESQWEVIKKVIDECDYYVLLIGGRYGSIAQDGLSYTEKEYNYARSVGIPVLAFVHGDQDSIPSGKMEKDQHGRTQLEAFKKQVMEIYPVRSWKSVPELGGIVSRSLSREIKVNPRPGWIRNEGRSNIELLEQINSLSQENSILKQKSSINNDYSVSDFELESGSDEFRLQGEANIHKKGTSSLYAHKIEWTANVSWDELFKDLGPILMNEADEKSIQYQIGRFIGWSEDFDQDDTEIKSRTIKHESYSEIMVQLQALGLIAKGSRKRQIADKSRYWALTEKGHKQLIKLLARRKKRAPIETP